MILKLSFVRCEWRADDIYAVLYYWFFLLSCSSMSRECVCCVYMLNLIWRRISSILFSSVLQHASYCCQCQKSSSSPLHPTQLTSRARKSWIIPDVLLSFFYITLRISFYLSCCLFYFVVSIDKKHIKGKMERVLSKKKKFNL